MKQKLHGELTNLLNQYKSRHSLPAPFYTQKEIFDLDMQTIFRERWVYVATEGEVREAGDYYHFNILDNGIIILRDDDGELRSFHNTCCHRGSKLCDAQRGNFAKIVCPYHQWTYNLDGKLAFAPQMPEDFKPSDHALKPIALENIGGLLFVCLSENPPDSIKQVKESLSPYLDMYNLKDTKVAAQADLVDKANWKLVMENNRECYHCNANHPELMVPLYDYGFGYGLPDNAETCPVDKQFEELLTQKTAEWEKLGLKYAPIEFPNNLWFRVARLPLANDCLSHTTDGKLGCKKLLAPFDTPEASSLSVWTHPNSWHHFMCDHIVTFKALPINERETLVRTKWLVHKDAVEGEDYDLEHLTHCWTQTNNQDRQLAERNHAGVLSQGYQPGPYSASEVFVDNFAGWYIDQIKELK